MKIKSVTTHSPITLDGRVTTFLHPDEFELQLKDSWVLVTSKRSGDVIAVPSANIPFMSVELEVEKMKARKGE